MLNIEQNICEAIQIIADNAVASAGFDRTIQGSILSCVNETTGKYKIRYQDSNLYAYTGDINKKYSKGTQVYILVPGNDMSKNKTILGEVGALGAYSDDNNLAYNRINYERNSENLILIEKYSPNIEEQFQTGLYSGTEYNIDNERYGKYLYSKTSNEVHSEYKNHRYYSIKLLEDRIISQYVKDSGYFYLGANFKTDMPATVIQGNYGIRVYIKCKALNEESNYVYNILNLDLSNGFTGNPYSFKDGSYQSAVFAIPNNFVSIDKIELFAKNFEIQETDPINEQYVTSDMYDILISNIGLYTANSVSDLIGENGIILTMPKGRGIYNTSISNLEVNATVFEGGNAMADNSNSFFWFKKDLSVTSVSKYKEYYNEYGGKGWACLNEKDINGWKPASNIWYFSTEDDLISLNNTFKVVSYREVGNTIISYSREFTLYNFTYDAIAKLYSPSYPSLALNRTIKDFDLRCSILRNTGNEYQYEYYWSLQIGNLEWFDENIIEGKFPGAEIDNNNITNINLGYIDSLTTNIRFGCTIKQSNDNGNTFKNLETIFRTITLDEYSTKPYTFEITEGIQVFQYDENEQSPFSAGGLTPAQLGLKLIDNQLGEEIDLEQEIITGNIEIEWIIPESEDETLLELERCYGVNPYTINDQTYYRNFHYEIKENYSYDTINNDIIAKLKYQGLTLVASTKFVFIKTGDYGTNGTNYTCTIVPNTDGEIPKWVVFTVNDTFSVSEEAKIYNYSNYGQFNFINRITEQNYIIRDSYTINNFPFKVRLFKNGNNIFEDSKTGYDTDGNRVEVSWYMKTLSYGSSIKDESNFIIEWNEDEQEWQIKYDPVVFNSNNKIIDGDKRFNPANILCCKIIYLPKEINDYELEEYEKEKEKKKLTIFDYLPIVKVVNCIRSTSDSNFTIDFDTNSGYSQVVYNEDTYLPKYNKFKNIFTVIPSEDISNLKVTWSIVGIIGIKEKTSNKYKFVKAQNLKITDSDNKYSKEVLPVNKFMGESVTNAILFKCRNTNIDSYIHIPICLHLNQYTLPMLNDWDGISIDIDEEDGHILAPKIGAGSKDKDNTFTGVIMGLTKDKNQKDAHHGLFAYSHSIKTFSLYSDSGAAVFGKAGQAQIIIDPREKIGGYIYSGNFFKDEAYKDDVLVKEDALKYASKRNKKSYGKYYNNTGMIINLTDGEIHYGNNNFTVDSNGNLTSIGGHFSNGVSGENESYLDLSPNESTYDNLLKFKNKFFITKNDGRVISVSGHFANLDESMFLDFQPEDEDIVYYGGVTSNGNYLRESSNSNDLLLYSDEEQAEDVGNIYPDKITGYLLYCKKKDVLGSSLNVRNLQFAITKRGAIIANVGKIGGFYISESAMSSKSLVTAHGRGDITLSTKNFNINDFISSKVRYNNDGVITGISKDHIYLTDLRLAINNTFAVDVNGNLYAQTVNTGNVIAQHIDADEGKFLNIDLDNIDCMNLKVRNKAEIYQLEVNDRIGFKSSRSAYIGISSSGMEIVTNSLHIMNDNVYTIPNIAVQGNSTEYLPWMSYGTVDLVEGSSGLTHNHIYLVIETTSGGGNSGGGGDNYDEIL